MKSAIKTSIPGQQTLTAVFDRCEEGGYSVYIKEVPGAISQGETIEEALANILDALHMVLSYHMDKKLERKNLSNRRHFEAELVLA